MEGQFGEWERKCHSFQEGKACLYLGDLSRVVPHESFLSPAAGDVDVFGAGELRLYVSTAA